MTALRIAERPSYISDREQKVLERIAAGEEIRTIARDLQLAERTVKNIIHDILTKLGARNRAHAVAIWYTDYAPSRVATLEHEVADLRARLLQIRRVAQ